MAAKPQDQEFVEFVVKSIVNNPNDVKVDRKVDEMGVLLTVRVNAEDMGALIGRAGSTARALRGLTRIIGLRNNARVNLKIEEPEGSTRKPVERDDAGKKDVDKVVEDLKL
ncbi:KH domain-containing protein [Patescibacteria group bacterium]|nr:KH domain-containing protein [Patescibacteria group bacterium]MBU3923055.1 KH domain-containing protein [Patescibacteria group bacterium]